MFVLEEELVRKRTRIKKVDPNKMAGVEGGLHFGNMTQYLDWEK